MFIANLSSAIDVLFRLKADGNRQFFTLEYSTSLATGAPGRVMVYDSPQGRLLVGNLTTPSSMALDAATGNLYITDRSDGTVLVMSVGN